MVIGANRNGLPRAQADPRRRDRLLRCGTAAWLAVTCVVCGSPSAEAQSNWLATRVAQPNGDVVKMPLTRPFSRWSKLSLTVDTRWTPNYGYRPVQVSVVSLGPAAATRTITIRLHANWSGTMTVEQEFELPAGSTSATATVTMPQFQSSSSGYYWWDVWVNGVKEKSLSLDWRKAFGVFRGVNTGSARSFLTMGSKAGARDLIGPNSSEFEVLSLAPEEFPTKWIDYTCFDVIALSRKDLRSLARDRPDAFQAIQRWLRAGGQVWVNDVGQEFEGLAELSTLFGLSESIAAGILPGANGAEEVDGGDESPDTGWRAVQLVEGFAEGAVTFRDMTTGLIRTERDPEVIRRLSNNQQFVTMNQQFDELAAETQAAWPKDSREWFVEQRSELGFVRAFRGTNGVSQFQQANSSANANAAGNEDGSMPLPLAVTLRSMQRWDARHGLVPDDANLDFTNLLVPGVGLAPVTEFRVLITLFVLVIGPLNYWLLKRWGRLQLMVLTVPVAAALITAALFGYAVLSDGFGSKVRAHSFTTLDQRVGESVCWSRLSYYSGLAPGQLAMPSDVVLYPIIPGWSRGSVDAHVRTKRDVVWEEDEATLGRGWLRSRTPTQYLSIRARKSPHRLEIATPSGKLRATNKLGASIQYLVVLDEANKVWAGEKLAKDAVAFLAPIDRGDAAARLRRLATDNAPQSPPELVDGDSYYRRYQMYGGRFGQQYIAHTLSGNLANDALNKVFGMNGAEGLRLPARSYVAVTETGPEVEFGMRGAKELGSFHVVVGQW
jgi:hypothetical protein